jgi:uncharacterized iron-regulated membrane protein
MTLAFWRKWHRWIGFPAALFLAYAAVTGIMVAFTEKFGEEEALREATRDMVSPVTLGGDPSAWQAALAAAFATANDDAGDLPVDRVRIDFKGNAPKIHIFTGKPTGGEDREFVLDAHSAELLSVESYSDKPLIKRIHSGEAFGDGGLVVAMFWGLALAVLTVTGIIIYLRMRRKNATGWKRVFW